MIHARGFYHVGRIFQNQLLLDCKAQCFMKVIVNIAHCSSGKPALSQCFIKLPYISGLRPLQRNLPNVREDVLFKVHPMPTHRIACQARFTVNAHPIPQIGLGGRGIFRAAKCAFLFLHAYPQYFFGFPFGAPAVFPLLSPFSACVFSDIVTDIPPVSFLSNGTAHFLTLLQRSYPATHKTVWAGSF